MEVPYFCSWSGGKDSCLALYHAIRAGGSPRCLFTMLTEDGETSRSHGLPKSLLEEQARRLGIPIAFNAATWEGYEASFGETLRLFKDRGFEYGVFGDIDIEAHRAWCVRICGENALRAQHPLWQRPRADLLEEFIDLGFEAVIVVTRAEKLGPEWLGRSLDRALIRELEKTGIDMCGESGEYHTVVTGGPLFEGELGIEGAKKERRGDYWFLKIESEPGS